MRTARTHTRTCMHACMQMSDAAVIYILLGLNALIVVALVVVFAISAVAHEKLFSMGQHEWCVGLPTMILWVGGGVCPWVGIEFCHVITQTHTHTFRGPRQVELQVP